jgi:hypothetical protein
MVSGDIYDYFCQNRTGYIEPVVKEVAFENRVKASPSVFSYKKLSDEELSKLPNYPEVTNHRMSNRIIGKVNIPIEEWDKMNAVLGPTKRVNVVLVRMERMSDAQLLESKWVGGKKNDLVLTYGNGWSYVFGWSEKELVKRNLETILIKNRVDSSIIPIIRDEIRKNYTIVDWSKFDYLDIEPSLRHYVYLAIVMVLTQLAFLLFAYHNDWEKDGNKFYRRRW